MTGAKSRRQKSDERSAGGWNISDAWTSHRSFSEALAKAPHSVPANRQIKTLIYIADSKPVIVLIRGADQLNEDNSIEN